MGRKSSKGGSPASELLDQYLDLLVKERGIARTSTEELQNLTQTILKSFLEKCLDAEMSIHLQQQRQEQPPEPGEEPEARKNKRNGYSSKTVTDGSTQVRINIPRDRNGEFEPMIVGKYQHQIDGLEEKVLSMYARGMSNRDISAHIKEIYTVELSHETISKITDAALPAVEEWRNRTLQDSYAVVFFDAMRVKIKEDGIVKSKSLYIGLGIDMEGRKEVLGMWLSDSEGATYWANVFNEIKNRGCKDILIAVTDGLKGMTEALETVFPKVTHQTCIVHLIRNSVAFVSYKHLKEVTAALKEIYRAATEEVAERKLEEFEASELAKRYPSIPKIWRSAWPRVVPLFGFPAEVRRLIYTTNAIEGLNRSIRKVIKTRTCFPSDTAAYKLVWLALRNVTVQWKRPVKYWKDAVQQLAILYPDRFVPMA